MNEPTQACARRGGGAQPGLSNPGLSARKIVIVKTGAGYRLATATWARLTITAYLV
jgi:hypothetical protein